MIGSTQRMHQQGFTLLELLVVITLLAVLSLGALVAYDGIGSNAAATAATSNASAADRAIRTYRAVALNYPSQWDNLSASDTGAAFSTGTNGMVATATKDAFGDFAIGAANASVKAAIFTAMEDVGIGEIQQLAANATATNVAPNLQHNEGANASAQEVDLDTVTHISIVPAGKNGAGAACTAGTQAIGANYSGTTAADAKRLNVISDSLVSDTCHLVIALGFGHDAAASTADSAAAIAAAPAYSSAKINPATSYNRFVALFHLGSAADSSTANIAVGNIRAKPHFLGVLDPEGRTMDENLASGTAAN